MGRAIIIALLWVLWVPPAFAFGQELDTRQIGTMGEEIVQQFWLKTGRIALLTPRFGNPNMHGPDHVFLTQGNRIEIHETKAYKRWPNIGDLETTVEGRPSMQLSKEWIENWISDENSTFHRLAPEVQDAIKRGKFERRVNFINSSTSELRVYEVQAVGESGIKQGAEIAGPYKIARSEIEGLKQRAKTITQISRIAQNGKAVVSRGQAYSIGKSGNPFKNLQVTKMGKPNGRVVPGFLTADGRLMVAYGQGTSSAVSVIVIDGGTAYYQYLSGDIDKAALNKKLQDAAIKAPIVGGGMAVAVLLGTGPGALIAIGAGAYIITDFAVHEWRENTKDRFLTVKDLTDIGFPVDLNISLNADQWGRQDR